jgi:hypothetical protein
MVGGAHRRILVGFATVYFDMLSAGTGKSVVIALRHY